jgi:hypothetical protein
MPAKVILYRLWFNFGIKEKTLLDLGSIFEGYVGRRSRSHTRKLNKRIIQTNLRRK